MAASNTAVYAVVDKSKKQKRHYPPQNESTLPNSFDSPVYDAIADTLPVPQRDEAFNSEYSMVTLDNMYSTVNGNTRLQPRGADENTQHRGDGQASGTTTGGLSSAITKRAKKRLKDRGTGCKLFTCVFITIAVVAIITLICLAILFAEILKLKAQSTSTQQPSQDQQAVNAANDFSSIMLQLRQINDNLSSIKNSMQTENSRIDHLNNTVDFLENQLIMSVDQLHRQLDQSNISLDNDIQQLNSLIEMVQLDQEATQELGQTLDSHIQQLNNSVEMVKVDQEKSNNTIWALLEVLKPGQSQDLPASSCATLKGLSPSGYYWVRASNGSAVRVYCDMTRSCGGVAGGWMRVAELDMNNRNHQCPSKLKFNEHTRTCRIKSSPAGCSPGILYRTISEYSKVCGKIRAFQIGAPESFLIRTNAREQTPILEGNYVDGVSLTHGNPKQHIWTFAAYSTSGRCTCGTSRQDTVSPPLFVGKDYFCDTGTRSNGRVALWAQDQCSPDRCCSFNTPPWFYKQLPEPITDNIEMRVCRDQSRNNEDIQIQVIEIYVQ